MEVHGGIDGTGPDEISQHALLAATAAVAFTAPR